MENPDPQITSDSPRDVVLRKIFAEFEVTRNKLPDDEREGEWQSGYMEGIEFTFALVMGLPS